MSKVVALIPARGGSKGIKGKNIIPLNGAPLISYTIKAAFDANVFDGVYVSSDDAKILAVSEHYGAIPVLRSEALAQDNTPTNPVIEEFISQISLSPDDIIILLQPTSPLRTSHHVVLALQQFMESDHCDSLISVTSGDSKYFYSFVINDHFLQSINEKFSKISRRQDLPEIYLPNGAVYIFSVGKYLIEKTIPKTNVLAYIMENDVSLDIDTLEDLAEAEKYLTQQGSELHD